MLTKQKNIIFSLDDFGISPKANENILQLSQTGKMDRVSVMPHGRMNEAEVAKLLASGVKLDVHVDLRNDIDPNRKIKDGVIKRVIIFMVDYFSGKISPAAMEKQWDGQIRDFQKIFGKLPDGMSSHQHVHFFPPYFKVILALAKKHKINYLRFGKEAYHQNSLVCLILNWFRRIDVKAFSRSGLVSSDVMLSSDWLDDFNRIRQLPQNKENEIIFHPERDEEMIFLERFIK
ncbi:MAG: ChbG/HpnK family deacetylase [Candidatus Moranbacteria bacterium]|nr:ChbG/HpnK family deacetylase [Candidatus Moranbacteria bacterium]